MPSIIDILIVIDAETLLSTYGGTSGAVVGSATNPVSVDQPLIYLVVRQANAVFGQGSKELKIKVQTEDVIRWREATTSVNGRYSAMLYKFFALRGASLISVPQPAVATVNTPLPNPADPLHPHTQTISDYFWSTTALNQGEATYAFQFAVMDRLGQPQGYFTWDPFIQITA